VGVVIFGVSGDSAWLVVGLAVPALDATGAAAAPAALLSLNILRLRRCRIVSLSAGGEAVPAVDSFASVLDDWIVP
jgi:hypothetical protein